jgi:cell division protein FtsQ
MLPIFFGTLGIFCLSLLFIFGHDIITQGRMFTARHIEVLGIRQLSESHVLSLAGIQPEANIFQVNLSLARKRLLSDGWIAEARVGRVIPDGLVVRVREHEPAVILDLGEKYLMSRAGTIIKKWEETDASGFPLVTGLDYSDLPLDDPPGRSFDALLTVLSVARKASGPLSLDRIERIDLDRDLGVTLHAAGPVKTARIGFGKYREKYDRIDRLMGFLTPQLSDQAVEFIDIERDSRVVAGPFPEVISGKTTRRS